MVSYDAFTYILQGCAIGNEAIICPKDTQKDLNEMELYFAQRVYDIHVDEEPLGYVR